ncbi:MAG: hypothetical protein HY815_18890 [Candidatus Riflebacteria bacterium]|nr:hypothetical protein [Candidatus Riflebacteria bacterium]
MHTSPIPGLRRFVKRAVFALVPLGLVLCLFELSLRCGWPGTELLAGLDRARQRAGSRNVVVLGDSFSLDQERSLGRLLRQHLESRGIACLSYARAGAGPIEYRDTLKLFGPVARPRLVMLNYYAGNDLTDTRYEMGRSTGIGAHVDELLAGCHLLAFVRERRRNLAHATAIPTLRQEARALHGNVRGDAINPWLVPLAREHRDYQMDNVLVDSPAAREAWRRNRAILRSIRDLCLTWDGKLLITVIPAAVQVDPDRTRFYRSLGFEVDQGRFGRSTVPQDLMAEFCKEERIAFHDLLPELSARRAVGLFLPDDDHFDPAGHEAAFRSIRSFLERERLL